MTTPYSQRPPYVLLQLRDYQAFREIVKARELSVRKLAARADVGPMTVGHLISGHRTQCRKESAERIAAALDLPVGALFRDGARMGRGQRVPRNTVAA